MSPTARSSAPVAILLTAVLAAPLHAATPREQLLRYVPEQVGFCLVLNDLRGHGEALAASPFVAQFARSPLGKELAAAAEVAQLAKIEKDLKDLLGLDSKQLRDEILGDAVVLAYRPGPPDKPEQEQGMILLHARDPKLLADMIERLNAKQKESGDLKETEEKEHNGVKYVRRTEKKDTNYYHLDGPVLLFTGQENLLKEAIDLGSAKKNAEPPLARRFRELGADKALLSLWVNPRGFDAQLKANLAKKDKTGTEAAFARAFVPYWKALDGVVVSVALEKELKVRLGFQARVEDMPPAARTFFKEASRPSEVWQAIPDDAMIALAGRIDPAALFELLGAFMPEADRENASRELNRTVAAALGRDDFFKDVLPHVGPDFGFYVSAPPADDKAWFPHAVLAVKVGRGDETQPLDRSVLAALDGFARFAVVAHNKAHPDQTMALKTMMQGRREVRYLVNDRGFPPGFRPALALHEGYVVLANSPEALGRFADAFKPGAAPSAADEVPLLRVSFKDLRRWLKERQDVLTPFLAEQHKLTKEEAQQRMARLLAGLEFVDRLEVSQRTAPGRAVFTLTLQTAQPLRN
jgi:hypothetical protein